ncbi:MAG: hypothetical protein IID28_04480 [Planctomycetes bacterium]|nr:hypothetical protein [Planctomycetota bacterium]
MSGTVLSAGVAGLFLALALGATSLDRPERIRTTPTGTPTAAITGAAFNVPGPGVGTLGLIGVIGLAGRRRRRRLDP